MNGRRTRNTIPLYRFNKEMIYTIILIFILCCIFGCSSLGGLTSEEIVEVVATEVAEAAPIVIANPTIPGALMAVISVVAGIAGAGLGAAAKKVAIKKKIAGGALGRQAVKEVDSL